LAAGAHGYLLKPCAPPLLEGCARPTAAARRSPAARARKIVHSFPTELRQHLFQQSAARDDSATLGRANGDLDLLTGLAYPRERRSLRSAATPSYSVQRITSTPSPLARERRQFLVVTPRSGAGQTLRPGSKRFKRLAPRFKRLRPVQSRLTPGSRVMNEIAQCGAVWLFWGVRRIYEETDIISRMWPLSRHGQNLERSGEPCPRQCRRNPRVTFRRRERRRVVCGAGRRWASAQQPLARGENVLWAPVPWRSDRCFWPIGGRAKKDAAWRRAEAHGAPAGGPHAGGKSTEPDLWRGMKLVRENLCQEAGVTLQLHTRFGGCENRCRSRRITESSGREPLRKACAMHRRRRSGRLSLCGFD
jgi:hypothetical protein